MRCLAVSPLKERDSETAAEKARQVPRQWPSQQTLSHWRAWFLHETLGETAGETLCLGTVLWLIQIRDSKSGVSRCLVCPGGETPRQPVPTAYAGPFATLERQCPDHVAPGDWQQAIEDGCRFLARWGEQTAALGWSARDLFGLHAPPANPAPNYRRLSRYDETGLIWLLRGRPVVALTTVTAAIENPTGAITLYRRSA